MMILSLQLLDYKSFTYTYLLADPDTKDAVLIDPVIEMVDRDVKIVRDMGLSLRYVGKVYNVRGGVEAFFGDYMFFKKQDYDAIYTCNY